MPVQALKLSDLTIDAGTQARAEIDQETVDDYALAVKRGDIFPPVTVFKDGNRAILADGFHRFHAHRKAAEETIEADVRIGTLHEAKAHAFKMPAHGKRWTSADKRKVIGLLLDTAEWGVRSDRAIADHIGVDHETVGRVRASLAENATNRQNVTAGEITGGAKGGKKPTAPKPEKPAQPKAEPKKAEKPGTPEQKAMAAGMESVEEINDRMRADLERSQNETKEYQRLASATEQGAENVKLAQRLMVATRRQDELMAEAASLKRLSDFYQHQLARVGKSIGERDMDKIAPAVESLTRRVREKYPSLLDANGVATKAPVAAVRR